MKKKNREPARSVREASSWLSVREALSWFPRDCRPSGNTYHNEYWREAGCSKFERSPGYWAAATIKSVDLCFEKIIGIYDRSPPGEPVFLPNPMYIEIR